MSIAVVSAPAFAATSASAPVPVHRSRTLAPGRASISSRRTLASIQVSLGGLKTPGNLSSRI
jgi:hypothetical protein